MCGIFGYVGNKKSAAKIILRGLRELEYRGYDSWGIAVVKDGTSKLSGGQDPAIVFEKHIGKISQAKVNLPPSSCGIGHTRWATHGGVTDTNAHPHLGCNSSLAVVHNGIVENFQDLKKTLEKKHKFKSETDTEVIAHLIEEEMKKKNFTQAAQAAFKKLVGLNAIVTLSPKGQIVVAKNGSPLCLGVGDGEYFVSSDAVAIVPHTKKVIFLEDGQGASIDHKGTTVFSLASGQNLQKNPINLDWSPQAATLGKYPHYMIKEIYEQPKLLSNIARDYGEAIKKLASVVKESYGTYIVGCGTAAHAALAGSYLFSRVANRHVNFAVGSEFVYLTHFLTPKSLVIALSQSGETIDIIDSCNAAKAKGAKIAALVNNLGSTLYRLADYKILLGAGPEKSVCATKSYTAKLAILMLLAYSMSGDLVGGIKLVVKASEGVEEILRKGYLENIKKLAKKLEKHNHIYIIGRGLNYPTALEAALKIKEISYIHAEGFASGELKHGVIALIEKNTPTICFAPTDETYDAIISGATEIKSRGGFIIGVSPKNNPVFDTWLPVRDVGDASPITNVVVAQLIAYFMSLERKNDPDKPRNLAKSVTVK